MKSFLPMCLALLLGISSSAQKVFFTSPGVFTEEQLNSDFYTSINLLGNVVLHSAPDYHLYAFDRNTGKIIWKQNLEYKSDIPPYFVNGTIWANKSRNEVVELSVADGSVLQKLPLSTLYTQPYEHNGTIYGTGIADGGVLFAFTPTADTLAWSFFLAHGSSLRPYYLKDKIVANAEGTDWVEIRYSGNFFNPKCKSEDLYSDSRSDCVKSFVALTHDGRELKGKLAQKINPEGFTEAVYHAPNHTIVLTHNTLTVLGNKLKKKANFDIEPLQEELGFPDNLPKTLKADESRVWFMYGNHLLVYNFKDKWLEKKLNLTQWEPHQALLDQNQLWLVSGKDGRVYGLSID